MKVAIVGGSGFIGSYLSKELKRAAIDFIIIDIVKSEEYADNWVYADITNLESLAPVLRGVTHIINLAAKHKDNVVPTSLYYEVNVQGAKNLCKVANELAIKHIVFTSSVAVYGFVEKNTDETGQFNPFNHYGISKLEAEKIYNNWQETDKQNSLVTIRPTVVFGIANRGNVYNLFKQIASGKFIMIGSGNNIKSMAYVENVASFISHTLSITQGKHVFNYVDKPDYTMNDLTKIICSSLKIKVNNFRLPYLLGLLVGYGFDFLSKLTNREFAISGIRVKKFCATTQFSSSNMKNSNFTPPVKLDDAILKTVQYEFKKDDLASR